MGQGSEWFTKPNSDHSIRNAFFDRSSKHTKNQFSNFFLLGRNVFSYIQENIIHHHHTKKAIHHVRKHHKKYIFGSAIGFLIIKIFITLLTTVGGGTFAQESDNQYFIGDGIISSYEQCDDSNINNGDGCSDTGQLEIGASCIGEPSICSFEFVENENETGNFIETGNLNQILNLDSTGIQDQDLVLDYTGITKESQEEVIETPIQEFPIPIQTGGLESTGDSNIMDLTTDEQVFRLSDLDNIDLLNYFYASGTNFTSNRTQNKCKLDEMLIVHVQPGYNTIPNFLNGNTIYLLDSGAYDTKYMINIENDCTALIGIETGVVLHTTVNKGANIKITSGSNNIIYNITLNGSTSSTGLVHSGNNYGIFVSTPDNTISNISSHDTIGFTVYMENFENNIYEISRFYSGLSGYISNQVNSPIIIPLTYTGEDIPNLLSGNGYIFSGNVREGTRPFSLFFNSVFPEKIDIYSIDYKIRVRISSGTRIVNSDLLDFTGILLGPKKISTSNLKDYFSGENILSAFKIGSDKFIQSKDIDNNIRDFSISISLDSNLYNQDLGLYYSLDGSSWDEISSFNISKTDSGINLKFLYDKFGQFLIVHKSLQDSGFSLDTGIIAQTGLSIFSGNIFDTGFLFESGDLNKTGSFQFTGKDLNGNILEKIDNEKKGLNKKNGDIVLTGNILSGSILSGEQDQLMKNMEKIKDKKEKFKNKLKLRGYSENEFGKMIGMGDLDISELSGEIDVDIIMQSSEDENIQIEIPEGIFFRSKLGENYTGIIISPRIFKGNINIKNFNPLKNIQVGSDDYDLFFYDLSGKDTYVTVRVPIDGLDLGTEVSIKYSSNGSSREHLTDTTIQEFSGKNYVIFQTNHFTFFSIGIITWDNTKFLDESFWNSNPSTGQIIKALYGSGLSDKTAYNSHWSGNCQPTNVVYIQPYSVSGLNSLPIPAANTVYVLNSGSYIFSANRTLGGNCIAIIGRGDVKFYSNTNLTSILTNTSRSYVIYDNLKFHGYENGLGGIHATKNTNGLRITSPVDSTFNNIESQQHSSYGVYLLTAPARTLFNNIVSHSNGSYGFYGGATSNYININSSLFFNNAVGGIYYIGNSGSLSNLQVFNNAGPGVYFRNGFSNILHNSQIYNNNTHGIQIQRSTNAASDIKLYNIETFNNGSNGVYNNNTSNNRYYGYLKVYGNSNNTIPVTISTGAQSDFIGAIDGYIESGTTGCHAITNPQNNLGQTYFTGNLCTRISNLIAYSGRLDFLHFSTGTLLQSSPYKFLYTGGNIVYNNWLFMNSGYHIGEGRYDMRQNLLTKGYQEGTGSVFEMSSDTLVISGSIDFKKTNGKTYIPVVLQSTGQNKVELYIPKHSFLRSGNNINPKYSYDKNLNIYEISSGSISGLTGVSGIIGFGNYPIYLTNFSGDFVNANVLIPITGLNQSDYVLIYSSTGLNNWSFFDTGNIINKNGQKYISFETTGLNYFATKIFIVDNESPLITGYLYSGNVYNTGNINYYKGSLDIRADVNEIGSSGLSGSTCEYSTGYSRQLANYHGNNISGYCEVVNMNYQSDFSIVFRIKDSLGNIGISNTGYYIYDNFAPFSGGFTINNNSSYTNKTGIVLNIDCPIDTGSSNIEIAYADSQNPSNWTMCTDSIGHYISEGDGEKNIYVLFRDGVGNNTQQISQKIILDTQSSDVYFTGDTPSYGEILDSNNLTINTEIYDQSGLYDFDFIYDDILHNIYDTGLILMYNFDKKSNLGESENHIRDFSHYSNDGNIHGGVSSFDNGVWNGSYRFNSNGAYISIGSGISLGTSHTISLWINPSSHTGVLLGNSSGHGIFLDASKLTYSLGENNQVSFITNTSLNSRNHITISRDGKNIKFFINGTLISAYDLPYDEQLKISYIGKSDNISYPSFKGYVDELRIYSRSMIEKDVEQLFIGNIEALENGKLSYKLDYSCMIKGGDHFFYSVVYDEASNKSISSGYVNIALEYPLQNVSASSIDIGQIKASVSNTQILSGQADGYFSVVDRKGKNPRYTTVSLPSQLRGSQNSNNIIDNSKIHFQANEINTIKGKSHDRIYVVGNFSGYVNVPSASTYIRRNQSDIPFMCHGGVYGTRPSFKVEVPAGQAIDTYSGTITYDIIY